MYQYSATGRMMPCLIIISLIAWLHWASYVGTL